MPLQHSSASDIDETIFPATSSHAQIQPQFLQMSQITFKDVKAQIPPFSGEPNSNYSIDEFVKNVDRAAILLKAAHDSAEKLMLATSSLTGQAKLVFDVDDQLRRPTTFQNFIAALRNKFAVYDNAHHNALEKMVRTRQLPGETVLSFHLRLTSVAKHLRLTSANNEHNQIRDQMLSQMVKQAFIAGLRPSIQRELIRLNPVSLDEAYTQAANLETNQLAFPSMTTEEPQLALIQQHVLPSSSSSPSSSQHVPATTSSSSDLILAINQLASEVKEMAKCQFCHSGEHKLANCPKWQNQTKFQKQVSFQPRMQPRPFFRSQNPRPQNPRFSSPRPSRFQNQPPPYPCFCGQLHWRSECQAQNRQSFFQPRTQNRRQF